jgi:hypothetical protein
MDSSTPGNSEISSCENSNPAPRGIAKYGRGAKAWISEDALRQKLERRSQPVKAVQPPGKEFVTQQVMHSKNENYSPSVNYITIDDIPFQVTDGGSKLLRRTGMLIPLRLDTRDAQILVETPASASPTPTEAIVSGVIFRRSKNGNLLRAGVTHQGFVFDKRY